MSVDWPLILVVMGVASIILIGFVVFLLVEARGHRGREKALLIWIVGISAGLFLGLIGLSIWVLGHTALL